MDVAGLNETHEQIMTEALASRQEKPGLGIQELLKKPSSSGFVDVAFLTDISVSMFVCENDDGVALRCLWNGPFEPLSMALWSTLASSAGCVVDVGAHSGIYSLVAYASSPDIAVISFEPYALNYARLSLNLRANGYRADLAIQSALSDKEGVIPFTVPSNAWYLSTGGSLTPKPETRTVPVNCSSLDILRSRSPFDPQALKIDVEGHELQVLQGASALLDQTSPDLILESVFNADTQTIEALLKERGYRFYIIDDASFELSEVDHLKPAAPGAADMNCLNRFVTKRSAAEVADLHARAITRLQ